MEVEVVAIYDVLPQILWTNHFLGAQGYQVDTTVLYQDNMSAMLLEQNGRTSSGRRTRHMNIRYFYIKDVIGRGEVTIIHHPTAGIVPDFFTKPLQGSAFKKVHYEILNIEPTIT